ncbi:MULTISPECIES: glycine betaine ABC transporter substrate-binding protein [unclassified Duganella]|uniref:glycine betaine ABC transporter substrate-binding protein n=1 Tax=unclassified Duganella TaxID=2636909 RepID=UPI0008802E1B|nr:MULTISPECIES: glycine betaine ABC transporter substrate-binding protein [unclassified Duganella]SDG24275.1 osmoprotectant transport system permease protein [Duganella sp. OV458]SDJ24092.1 osmoprotectant transport system permease protein [Duganella sp. OV510]
MVRRWLAVLALLWAGAAVAADTLHIGSKRFAESYILGEMLKQVAAPHAQVEHLQGLGNTAIVLAALQAGRIDVYPEYVGTIDLEILKHAQPTSMEQIRKELAVMGLGVAVPLGFNNTYALAVRGGTDAPRKLSELAGRDLKFGLSHEFIGRVDGWQGLAQRYGLAQRPEGLDHGIAYEALKRKQVDVIDVYSTEARIAQYGLRVLEDDRSYFPRYDAVLLYRLDAAKRFPAAWKAIGQLEGCISEQDMIAMNAAAEINGVSFDRVARDWLAAHPLPGADVANAPAAAAAAATERASMRTAVVSAESKRAASVPAVVSGESERAASAPAVVSAVSESAASLPAVASERDASASSPDGGVAPAARASLLAKIFDQNLWRLTRQHLTLVLLAVALACVIGVPLGVLAAALPRLRQFVLGLTGVLQTIPSLALLALLIPLLGTIGTVPALVALVVYALLPIVRNTCTGLLQVSPGLMLAAKALGLRPAQRLIHIELPLALPVILAGVKTAAVLSVGTATIAAFIGAGGYGERITIGLALNDNDMLLAGAIPAAILALLTQGLFELLERTVINRQRLSVKSP